MRKQNSRRNYSGLFKEGEFRLSFFFMRERRSFNCAIPFFDLYKSSGMPDSGNIKNHQLIFFEYLRGLR